MKEDDVSGIERLRNEFEAYLQNLSHKKRHVTNLKERRNKLLKDGFGRGRAFYGIIAKKGGKILDYILYHYGYGLDEMQGHVVYVIDLFVTKNARGRGIGTKLMREVSAICKQLGGTSVYFAVWKKNKSAVKFYKKLGADLVKDVPSMRLGQ